MDHDLFQIDYVRKRKHMDESKPTAKGVKRKKSAQKKERVSFSQSSIPLKMFSSSAPKDLKVKPRKQRGK
jgi:hypothetical protein